MGASVVGGDSEVGFFNEREDTAVNPDASAGGVDNSFTSILGVGLILNSSGSALVEVCVEAVGEP